MSTEIDQRVVQMRFDNSDFDKNVNQTISALDKLKAKLTFKESAEALEKYQKTADNVNFDTLSKSADKLEVALSTKVIAKLELISNIVNRVTNAGIEMVKSLSIDQVTSGFGKYEQKLANTQGIINATGESLETVNAQLDKLMWYTDETSYSFMDMANTISRFTSNDIPLDKTVTAIIGIGNAAGLAGVSVQDASHAMAGFAKAVGGYMDRQNWQWIQTAHMDTSAFKQQLIESALAMGTLKKTADGANVTLKGTAATIEGFELSLSDKWLTGDVLMDTLRKFGNYSEGVYQLYQNGMMTADAMDALSGKFEEVGEKGMRAAQESKTFSDALNAVKDAVSSGWMQTFEILFGNFDEAKEIWSTVYDELYDIFAASGEIRNSILKDWSEAGGRDELLETIGEAWGKVKDTFFLVKEAASEIFPPVTAENILAVVRALREFISQFQLSKEAAYSLKVILKALILPFKLLGTAIRAAGLVAQMFILVMFKLTNTLLTMFGSAEKCQKVFQKLFGEERGLRMFNAVTKIIGNLGSAITSVANKAKELYNSLKTNENLIAGFKKLKDILMSIGSGGLDIFVALLESIANGDITIFFGKIQEMIPNVIGAFHNAFGAVGLLISNITKAISEFGPFKTLMESVTQSGNSFKDVILQIADAVVKFVGNLSPAKILVFGFGTALVALLYRSGKLIEVLTGVIDSFKGLGKSFKSVFDAIAARIKPYHNQFIDFAKAVAIVAASIVVLAGAMKMLSTIDSEKLKSATIAIGALMGGMLLFSGLMAVTSKFLLNTEAIAASFKNVSIFMFSISAAIIVLVGAMKLLSGVDPDGLKSAVNAVVQTLMVLTIAAGLLSTAVPKLSEGSKMLTKLASAVLILAIAIKLIGNQNVMPGIVALMGSMAALVVLAKTIQKSSKELVGVGGEILAMTVSLGLLSVMFKIIGDMFLKHPEEMVVGAVVALTEIIGIMLPMFLVTKAAGKQAAGAGKAASGMALALLSISAAIFVLGNMDQEVLIKGGIAAAALMAVMAIITRLSSMLVKNKEKIAAGNKGAMSLASAMIVLSLAIRILGSMDPVELAIGGGAIAALIGIMALCLEAGKEAEKAKGSIISITVALGLVTAALMLLSLIDGQDLAKATASLSIAMLAIGGSMKLMEKINFNTALAAAMAMGAFLIEGIAIMDLLSRISDNGDLVSKAYSFGIIIAAIAVSALVITKASTKAGKWENLANTVKYMFGYIALAVSSMVILGNLGGSDPAKVIANAAAFSIAMLAIAKSAEIIIGIKIKDANPAKLMELVGVMSAISIVAGVIVGFLGVHGGQDWQAVLANAAALSATIMAVGVAVKLMNGVDFKMGVTQGGAMGLMLLAASAAILIVAQAPTDGILAKTISLIAIIAAMVAVAEIFTKFKIDPGAVAIGGASLIILAAEITAAIAVVGGIITGIGALFNAVEWLMESLDKGSEVFSKVGSAIGNFFGSIVGGIGAGISDAAPTISENIATFLNNLDPVVGVISKFDDTLVTKANNMTSFVTNFLKAIQYANSVNLGNIVTFGSNLALFGPDFATFASAISGYGSDDLVSAAAVVDTMSQVVERLPRDKFFSKAPDLTKFGQQLVDFAPYIVSFAEIISAGSINPESVTASVAAADTIATFAQSLDGKFDLLSVFSSSTTLSDFGAELASFGENFVKYCGYAEQIDKSVVDSSVTAGAVVVAFAKTLPASMESVQGMLSGKKSLSDFGSELATFGEKFVEYCKYAVDINPDIVNKSMAASDSLVSFANALPTDNQTIIGAICGKKSLSKFGEELASFGPNFKAYGDTVKFLKTGSVTASAKAAKEVIELYSEMPTTGGLLDAILGTGTMSLEDFGKNLKKFGEALQAYDTSVSGVDTDKISDTVEASKQIISLSKNLADFEPNNIVAFKNGVDNLALTGVSSFLQRFSEAAEDFKTAGENVVERVLNGVNIKIPDLHASSKNMVDAYALGLKLEADSGKMVEAGSYLSSSIINHVKGRKATFVSAGKELASGLAMGISTDAPKVHDSMLELARSTIEAVNTFHEDNGEYSKKYERIGDGLAKGLIIGVDNGSAALSISARGSAESAFKEFTNAFSDSEFIGENLIRGIQNGIKNYTEDLMKTTRKLGRQSIDAIKDEMGIHSPSTEGEEIGMYFDEGVARGVEKNSNEAEDAARLLGMSLVWGLEDVLDNNNFSLDFLMQSNEVTLRSSKMAQQKIDTLTKQIEDQNKKVTAAERHYLSTMEQYGEDSEETNAAFKRWVEAKSYLSDYQTDLVNAQAELEEALANEVRTNTNIPDAVAEKVSAVVDAFKNEISRIDVDTNIAELEYKLWGNTFGLNATEEEKSAKELELLQAQIESSAKKVKIAEQEWRTMIATYGEGSDEAKQYYVEFLEAQNDLAELAQKMTESRTSLAEANQEAYRTAIQMMSNDVKSGLYDQLLQNGYTAEELMQKYYDAAGYNKELAAGTISVSSGVVEVMNDALSSVDISNVQVSAAKAAFVVSTAIEDDLTKSLASGSGSAAIAGLNAGLSGITADDILGGSGSFMDEILNGLTGDGESNVMKMIKDVLSGKDIDFKTLFMQSGADLLNGLVEGASGKLDWLSNTIDDWGNKILGWINGVFDINSPSKETMETGGFLTQGIGVGLINALRNLKSGPIAKFGSYILSAFNNLPSEFESIGENCMLQVANGFDSDTAINAADVMMEGISAGMKSSPQANELGRYFDQELANGIRNYSDEATDSSYNTAEKMVSVIKNAIKAAMENTDDLDDGLTITPVIDLDEATRGLRKLKSMISAEEAMTVGAEISASRARREEVNAIPTSSNDSGQTITFTQNNYSPKALSRLEIYRDTKNQLSRLKGVTSR